MMKWFRFVFILVVLFFLRELAGGLILRLVRVPIVVSLGSLLAASFVAGWLASAIARPVPTDREFTALAVLGVLAHTLAHYTYPDNIGITALIFVLYLIFTAPISYVALILGARVAEGE